jgi:hypothetical protein
MRTNNSMEDVEVAAKLGETRIYLKSECPHKHKDKDCISLL